MKYRGIFEYEYPTEHKPPVSIDVYLHGDCVKGKIIEWEYRPLEQEPTTKNDLGVDCISRDEVCRYVAEFVNHEFSTREEEELIDNIITGIERMPSVTPQEPRKGEWCPQNDDYFDWYECSECGYGSEGEMQYSSEHDVRTNYCPNCGAKMVEPQESEDKQ